MEYCLSSLTCQGGATKQLLRKLLFMLLLEEYHTLRACAQPGIAFDFKTVRYIFIYFFILLNNHFDSITTRIGFDFHW